MSTARQRFLDMVGNNASLCRALSAIHSAALKDREFLKHLERDPITALAEMVEIMPDRSSVRLKLEFVRTPPIPLAPEDDEDDDDELDADIQINDETYRGLDGFIEALKT